MDEPESPVAGMTISVRSRRDVMIVDPDRFLAAARAAFRELNPDVPDEEVAEMVTDVQDAVAALLERDGILADEDLTAPAAGVGRAARMPGSRELDRPDGLSPAGYVQEVVLHESRPLQDYGCFLPDDWCARPAD